MDSLQQPDLSLEDAFVALRLAVAEMLGRDRVTRFAGVKPVLQRRLPRFDERAFGFRTFGEFVAAAAAAGAVRVETDADNWDRVLLVEARDGDGDEPSTESLRVRRDLWAAVTTWGRRWINVWDRSTAQVVRLAREPADSEQPEHAALRRALGDRSNSAVPIEPVPMDEQLAWLEDFIGEMPDGHWLTDALRSALGADQPFRVFGAYLRADLEQHRRYQRFRARRVIDVLHAWARDNDVQLDSTMVGAAAAYAPRHPEPVSNQPVGIGGRDVRSVILRAVERMPTEELRRLPIPAGYILDALR